MARTSRRSGCAGRATVLESGAFSALARGHSARCPFNRREQRDTGVRVTERLHHGRLRGAIAEVVDAGVDLLPHFELAAITVLDGQERPGELPPVRRRL